MRLVVAPRHIQRADEAESDLNEPVLRRSAMLSARDEYPQNDNGDMEHDRRVILVDTLGELTTFYGLATIAVIGGSFYPGVQGHNPIEPAALGVPVVFGPYMRNFADAAEVLVEAGAAIQVTGPEHLTTALAELLRDPDRRSAMGRSGRATVSANRGALTRTLSMLAPFISRNSVELAETPHADAAMPSE
jgi:3-deoxy-D-manno-octulosonic-acid transferase